MGYDFIVKPFHGDFVNLEQGTGVVHIAPGHGDDDYVLGIENNVDIIQTVQDGGRLLISIRLILFILLQQQSELLCERVMIQ